MKEHHESTNDNGGRGGQTSLDDPILSPPASAYQGLQHVTISVLGAQGVGKTSIVEQFVGGKFREPYVQSSHQCYYPSILVNNHLYEVKVVDCPAIPYFPRSTLTEWTEFRGYSLRSATAYILVFDVTNYETLQYIRSLRDQIISSRGGHHNGGFDIPMVIVGNKHDLPESSHISKRELDNVIKKQWKCSYIKCSAKHNWHVVTVFKELMKEVDLIDYTNQHRSSGDRRQYARAKCVIL